MPLPALPEAQPWWTRHQQALQLFRNLGALQRVRPMLQPGTLAWWRLDHEQAALETAIETLRLQRRADKNT